MKAQSLFLTLSIFLGTHAFADCHQFDGTYVKKCTVSRSKMDSENLEGALDNRPNSHLIIQGTKDCSAITFNDPEYNGVFASVYLTTDTFDGGAITTRQKGGSPQLDTKSFSADYIVKDHGGDSALENVRSHVSISLNRVDENTLHLNYSANSRMLVVMTSSFHSSCVLTKVDAPKSE